MRHESLVRQDYPDKDAPLEIRIDTDTENHTFTVTDTGIGMTREELETNLGTIAKSGTREFLENLQDKSQLTTELIGKFGVGFYSAFMVADEVRVRTRSVRPEARGYEWVSDGSGTYTITEMDGIPRGASVVVKLREDAREYENADTVKNTVRKYSNFVPFPIQVSGERVNTIQAIWTKSPSEVSDAEYNEFFKYISNQTENPLYRLHISSDAPMQFSAILYVPETNLERFGFFRQKPQVDLYSRKVLIVQHAEELMPEYLRFIHGVVDSADLPLNISRETLQDNLVFRKLKRFLTRRIIRFFADEAKRDPKQYTAFWNTFGLYIKEGSVSDYENRAEIASLLRFRSSAAEPEELVSLDTYATRMREGQNTIYYLSGRTREEIDRGPYISSFRKRGIEVLYLLDPIDDFVMTSLGEYQGKKLVSADSADIELPAAPEEEKKEPPVPEKEMKNFLEWMKDTLGGAVTEVRSSKRDIDRPAIIVNPEEGMTTTMRRVLKASGQEYGSETAKILEVNPSHPLIVQIEKLREGKADKGFLQECVRQIYDNALSEAGLLEDPRNMVERVYALMERALRAEEK
jgi:molecular chaperone HtpG